MKKEFPFFQVYFGILGAIFVLIFSGEPYNMNRWMKYRNYVREKEKFSLGDVKAIMAHEIVDQHEVANVHNSGTVHTVIVDYATGTIHVSFTKGMMAEDVPHFVDIGRY